MMGSVPWMFLHALAHLPGQASIREGSKGDVPPLKGSELTTQGSMDSSSLEQSEEAVG